MERRFSLLWILWKFFSCVNKLQKLLWFRVFFNKFSLLHYDLIIISIHIWFSIHYLSKIGAQIFAYGSDNAIKSFVNLKTKKINNKVPDQNRSSYLHIIYSGHPFILLFLLQNKIMLSLSFSSPMSLTMLSIVHQGQQPKASAFSSQHSPYAVGAFQVIFNLKSSSKTSWEINWSMKVFLYATYYMLFSCILQQPHFFRP